MMAELSMGTKLLIWIAFVLAWPMITLSLVKRVLDEESNTATFFMLATYTVLDTLVAWGLLGFGDLGIISALMLLAGAVTAAIYNFIACAAIHTYGG